MKRLTPTPSSSAWIASLALSLSALSTSLYAADAKKGKIEKITYEEHIFPLFEDKCMNCHNPDEAKGGLDLSNYGSTMAGGSGGSIAETENSGSSRLYTLMAHSEEPYMPPKKPKAPDPEIELIKKWIDGGLLETSGSVAKKSSKPKLDMNLVGSVGVKPDGPAPMPQHLLLEPAVVTERPNAVPDMARSPWAPIVAIAGQKQVLLYQSEKAELLGILPYPEGYPQALSFSQNGSLLLCGGGRGGKKGGVVVWDIKNGNRVIEVGREFDIVLGADISPDNRRVALGGPGRNMKIFDTITGEQLFSIKKHSDWLMALAYSPDGVLLASGGRGGDLFVWEAETAIEFYSLNGHSNAVTSLSWRSDANVLASASEDGTVILWEMGEGKQVKKWNAHTGGVLSVNFAPDGRLVTAGRDKTVKIWKADGKLEKSITASDAIVMSSVFTNDSKRIVSGDWKGNIKIWDATSGKEVASLIANPPSIDGQLHESELAMKKIAGTMPKLQEGVKAATAQTTAVAKQLGDAKKAVADAMARKVEMEKQAKAMIAQVAQMAANVKKSQQNLTTKQGESAKRTAELQKMTGAVTAANAELKKWTAESTKRQQVVTTLNAAAQKAKTLADQSKVDPKMSKSLADAKAAHTSILKAQKDQQNQLAALSKNMQAADAKMKAAAKPTPPALIKAHQDAVNQVNQVKGQLAATGKRLAEVGTQLKPLQASFAAASAKQKQSSDALAKQLAAQQVATKSLLEAQGKLAAANKNATTLAAQLKASQQADTNAKAAVKKAQTLLADASKASAGMKPKMTAAEKAKQQAIVNADAMEKQRLAREKSYQTVAKKSGVAKKTLEMAKLQLNTNQYLVKKWQAAAVNLKVHKASDKLDDMTEELDDMMEEVAESTEDSRKASSSLMAVKKTLSEAKLTIEKGRKTLVEKSSAVLETALKLAATKAMVAAASSKKQNPGKVGNQQTDPEKAKTASPDAMKSDLSDLQARLAKLEGMIKGAYADAGKTQKQIDQASAVVAKTPSLISERAQQQAAADAALKKALAEKEAQAAKIAAQQKTIEELRAKYLKMLPKEK
ncbi:MAG: hypothetical protein L3J39_15660 [Verrucomicrobiales bacterium]|nr:hypothetical protein [Verrucomicrobiales bacterium]